VREIEADVCVIGAGAGGLSVAAGTAQLGRRTVLIERARMGGDCLYTGCVPSKSLLAAAKAAAGVQAAAAFGVHAKLERVDFAEVRAHLERVIRAIEPNDSEERFRGLGVTVLRATARFVDRATVETSDGARVRSRHFVIATGSRAALPPVAGLDQVPYLTNETLFDLTELPGHLAIIGGGPIGMEMAQAFRRLGAAVTVIERLHIMPKDDPELVDVVRRRLIAEGVVIREGADLRRVEPTAAGARLHLAGGETVDASHVLVAAGRRPNVEELGLDAAGVARDKAGITVDGYLRSSNRRIYAVGDVAGGPQFTHLAGQHASQVIRHLLFRPSARPLDLTALPWVTYTDPELAHVGLTEAAARERHGKVEVVRWPLKENDRAQAEGATEGLLKVVMTPGGRRVLGASLVGQHAGELIAPWILAVAGKIRLGTLLGVMAPYPTLAEVNKRAAGAVFSPRLFSAGTRRLVRFLAHFT
jgi:pyruvate/2-oxoglutarate dehydrogenase complex dihydrolipoamide dehydrogenase (E3) component